jgi:hypothetical protein
VDAADVRLESADLAAVLTATQPILVERAMYWSRPGQPFAAGHAAAGVGAPSTSWYFAEGATGSFFETFLLLLNPSSSPATCTVQFQTTSGAVFQKPCLLPPESRTTLWVDMAEVPGAGRALANQSFATLVTVTNGVPIVAERAMWWPDGDWQEAHVSPGATATASRWAVADGDAVSTVTCLLIANASAAAGDVRVTLFFEDGSTAQRQYAIGASQRLTVDTRSDFPQTAGRRFGALVEAVGAGPALIVERSTYWHANGVFWAGGTNALGVPVP